MSIETEFQTGEVVNVTIHGVRVAKQFSDGSIQILDEHNDAYGMPPQAAVERITSADWPPQRGDLWRDRDADLWLCCIWINEGKQVVGLACARRELPKRSLFGGALPPEKVLERFGPLTLVHREDPNEPPS